MPRLHQRFGSDIRILAACAGGTVSVHAHLAFAFMLAPYLLPKPKPIPDPSARSEPPGEDLQSLINQAMAQGNVTWSGETHVVDARNVEGLRAQMAKTLGAYGISMPDVPMPGLPPETPARAATRIPWPSSRSSPTCTSRAWSRTPSFRRPRPSCSASSSPGPPTRGAGSG